jgi:hypothetical protein
MQWREGREREREKQKGGEEKRRGERGEAEQISHNDFVWHPRDLPA